MLVLVVPAHIQQVRLVGGLQRKAELPALDAMIVLQSRLRDVLKRTEPDQARRNAVLQSVLDDALVWKLLRKDPESAWEKVSARYLHA